MVIRLIFPCLADETNDNDKLLHQTFEEISSPSPQDETNDSRPNPHS
jgi:hypothetical protein